MYYKRILDKMLANQLLSSGAVLIEGPKWCGKTRTALESSNSHIKMQDPDSRNSNIQAANIKTSLLLEVNTPRLIDEWQVAPVLWDAVRHEVDNRGLDGQFILTGSVSPVINGDISHTGKGRISRLLMRPMSLFESLESNGTVSLKKLFDGDHEISQKSDLSVIDYAFAIVRGGWPQSVKSDSNTSSQRAKNYVDSIINEQVQTVDGMTRDKQKMFGLLKSISRNISTEARQKTILTDMEQGNSGSISNETYQNYIKTLESIFVLENLKAWNPSVRSATRVRTTPKLHFVDPSIATASLGINEEALLKDFNTFGYLFESICIRDLRVYADSIDGNVYHYRDSNGLECDAIVSLRDGRWGAIEVKMGSHEFDKAADNLSKLNNQVKTEPSFLMILTATEYAYKREDGVLVVPLGVLKD